MEVMWMTALGVIAIAYVTIGTIFALGFSSERISEMLAFAEEIPDDDGNLTRRRLKDIEPNIGSLAGIMVWPVIVFVYFFMTRYKRLRAAHLMHLGSGDPWETACLCEICREFRLNTRCTDPNCESCGFGQQKEGSE
jgi:hypothetical protein